MRGLKPQGVVDKIKEKTVASFTDAWIETKINISCRKLIVVASFTDAWIETPTIPDPSGYSVVASFTDAWIETTCVEEEFDGILSHLLQMRGLKHQVCHVDQSNI